MACYEVCSKYECLTFLCKCNSCAPMWCDATPQRFGAEYPTLAPAVAALVEGMLAHLAKAARAKDDPAAATDLRDQWRLDEFYQEDTDKVKLVIRLEI